MTEVATRVEFAREPVDAVIGAIGPAVDQYRLLETHGQLRIYTVRADSEVVGYAIYLVAPALHYCKSLQARQDVLFLAPEYRFDGTGRKLIEFACERLRLDGVQVVYQSVTPEHNLGPLLEQLGYELSELIYTRRLS